MLYEVIPNKIFRAGGDSLTYSSDLDLKPGHIVSIPLGKTSAIGIVKSLSKEKPTFKVKKIEKLLYQTPLPSHLLSALLWLSDYYLLPLPSVIPLFLPQGVEKNRRKKLPATLKNYSKLPNIPLNPAQKNALEAIQSAKEATKLLHGVTGSGKTNIYLKMASECLTAQKSAIILVPEIALTSQLVQVFESTFGAHVTLIHSRQTEAERHQIWESLLVSNDPQIVIGPRSALFAPLKNLGLIIIDEAHESAYYQENSPKYSSLRLASFIAHSAKITCLLGTATPLISDYYVASHKDALITLSEKAKKTAITPKIQVIDLKEKENFKQNHYFSDVLLSTIAENLKNHHQTLIFHNRRGSSPLTICEKCGWQALCPSCFLPLTLHSDSYSLLCHACGYSTKIPHICPECHASDVIHKGFGTKLLETELKKLFKTAKIARFDADNKKNETLDSLYSDVKSGDIDILIGTQTLARGLDLPNLASVGIVQADSGLSLPDFSAEERTFHLLTQVIGRVGRGHLNSASVIIQTFQPENPVITCSLTSDYAKFYAYLSKKRKKQHFPPFSFLAKVSITMKTEPSTIKKIQSLHSFLEKNAPDSIKISRPAPAFHEKTVSGYTWQITLKSSSRKNLVSLLSSIDKKLTPHITLDPPSLL
ncbi:primosomal protein N' [Candidatus Saccharibacteria bacterium]|nr:primosomal protein N' [Candidatus Saccharibacteria bacterium]